MATIVEMPQLGETVTSGTIISWMKEVGDQVAIGDILVEISTDKVDTELPSEIAGTLLEILIPVGEMVEVGTGLCVIGEAGSAPVSEPSVRPVEESAATAVNEPEPPREVVEAPPLVIPDTAAAETSRETATEAATAAPVLSESARFVSPVVRRLAREHGVDLAAVVGTGQGGRVTRRDLEDFLSAAEPEPVVEPEPANEAEPATEPVAESAPPASAPTPGADPVTAPATPASVPSGEEDLSRMRQVLATNMVKSVQTAVHTFTSIEVDFEQIERVRSARKAAFKTTHGRSLTYLPFVVRAVLDALRAYPVVNSSLMVEDKKRVIHPHLNIGIAVDLDGKGLVVPVIKGADSLRLSGIALKVFELADGARSGSLGIDDYSGSTFSITNNGAHGSFVTSAIINQPNSAILSTDGVSKRPTVVTSSSGEDVIAIHHMGMLGFTWDHRAFDGAVAAQFLSRVRDNLETWDWEQELL